MTREQALSDATTPLTHGYRVMLGLDGHSIEQAAHAAYTPTGPDLGELINLIRHRRNQIRVA